VQVHWSKWFDVLDIMDDLVFMNNSSPQVIHARSGVPYEIMGLMQGKVVGTSLVIMDSFPLPVQGTETRVNAADSANEFMVQYTTSSDKVRSFCLSQIELNINRL
jgi:hypothetical protein